MLKKAALAFGVVFVLIGVLGFVPGITSEDDNGMKLLLGLFMVDTVHNIVHLASGLAALALSTTERNARLYFQVFGVVYALVTVLGFLMGDGEKLLGLFHVNMADNFLHLVIAAAALYLGFVAKKDNAVTSA